MSTTENGRRVAKLLRKAKKNVHSAAIHSDMTLTRGRLTLDDLREITKLCESIRAHNQGVIEAVMAQAGELEPKGGG